MASGGSAHCRELFLPDKRGQQSVVGSDPSQKPQVSSVENGVLPKWHVDKHGKAGV
jgi:hypothetical protein